MRAPLFLYISIRAKKSPRNAIHERLKLMADFSQVLRADSRHFKSSRPLNLNTPLPLTATGKTKRKARSTYCYESSPPHSRPDATMKSASRARRIPFTQDARNLRRAAASRSEVVQVHYARGAFKLETFQTIHSVSTPSLYFDFFSLLLLLLLLLFARVSYALVEVCVCVYSAVTPREIQNHE